MSSLVHVGRTAATRVRPTLPAAVIAERGSTAADLMTRAPAVVHRSASMWSAWDLLHRSDRRHVVVVDDRNRVLGVLDDRTLALEWPHGPMAAHRVPVHTLLRDRARPRVAGEAEVRAVARTMVGAGVDALPVVDRDGRLLGLVTLWHLAEVAAGHRSSPADEG